MIALANLWRWVQNKPPKYTHLNLTEAFPFAASAMPAGGSRPPGAYQEPTRW